MSNNTREKLEKNLQVLLEQPEKNKISVTDLAATVGISHSTIYNRHSDIITKIQAYNKTILLEKDDSFKVKWSKTKEEKVKLKDENTSLKSDIQKLVSLNAKYEIENQKLKNEVSKLQETVSNLNSKYGKIKLL